RRRAGDVRGDRHPGRHLLPELAVPAERAACLGAADGPGVPATHAGDRRERPPGIAAAASRWIPRPDGYRPAADGRGSAAADRGRAQFWLPHRAAAGATGHRRGHRPVLPGAAVTALSGIAADQAGVASGLMTTAHEIGAALGVAVFSAVGLAVTGGVA